MTSNAFYYDLSRKTKEQEHNFMTAVLIKSKIKLGLDKDPSITDDSMIYIAQLLVQFASPQFFEQTKSYVRDTDIDVFKMADSAEHKSRKYYIYKVNADNLLMNLGLFQKIKADHESRAFHYPKSYYVNRGRMYYEIAQDYLHQIYRKKTALYPIFDTLSQNFDKYLGLITEVRKDYFSLLIKDKNSSFSRFLDGMDIMEEKILWEKKQDELLDLYSQWLKSKSNKIKEKLFKLATELQIINSEFSFQLPA